MASLIVLFFGFGPADLWQKVLQAINGQAETVNLYANTIYPHANTTDTWTNESQALGRPELAGEAGISDYSPDNSAIYTGGFRNLVIGNWRIAPEEYKKQARVIVASTSQEFETVMAGDLASTTSEISSPTPLAASTSPAIASGSPALINFSTTSASSASSTMPEQEAAQSGSGSNSPIIQQASDVESVEIIDLKEDAANVIEIRHQSPAPEEKIEPGPAARASSTSLGPGLPLGLRPAQAREEGNIDLPKNLKELGEFKQGRIKLSLAAVKLISGDAGSAALDPDYDRLPEKASSSAESTSTREAIPNKPGPEKDALSASSSQPARQQDPARAASSSQEVEILEFDGLSMWPGAKAARAQAQKLPKIIIWYALVDEASSSPANPVWHRLETFDHDYFSNLSVNGYLTIEADFLRDWQDIEQLRLRFEGVIISGDYLVYLDSAWIEAEYEPASEARRLEKIRRQAEALSLMSQDKDFAANQPNTLEFVYTKNESRIWDTLGEMLGLGNFWQDVYLDASLKGPRGQSIALEPDIIFEEDGAFRVLLPREINPLQPGEYTLAIHIEDRSGEEAEVFDFEEEFSWGVLALNFNKSVYTPDEPAYIQMAALDKLGHTICNADLELLIIDPAGRESSYSTRSGNIEKSPACGPETVTDQPDYYAYYDFRETGEYRFTLRQNTGSRIRQIEETIAVVGELPFSIERIAPTRIWPKADYAMRIIISANQDFRGEITERAPSGFKMSNVEIRITNSSTRDPFGAQYRYREEAVGGEKIMTWEDIELMAGDELEISYGFDAPDRSPELYLLGPLSLGEYGEKRNWQIASDALRQRARTVKFLAGTYSGNGGNGQNSDTNQTFSAFNFRLAETGVDIKNAFVVFESQFEAYADNSGDYSGYNLAFDACEESCSADAFSGTNRVLVDDNTVLAYDETFSNFTRLLLDVSEESELAGYSGNGEEMEAQVGYRIERGGAVNSIASARAVLVLTYAYDADSENITNTVAYPLESDGGGDSGSRQGVQDGDCTLGTDCPTFSYNMAIPEFPGYATSSHRLSQWQSYHEVDDNHGGTDVRLAAQIYGESSPSPYFFHEAARGSTQGAIQNVLFNTLTGYSENSDQAVEFQAYTNSGSDDHAIQGGEIFETYIASSSTATKTRTVSFPLGVLSTGMSDNSGYRQTLVYLAENGSATGSVEVQKAWFRIITHDYTSGGRSVTVNSKVGGQATSSSYSYSYNLGAVVKSSDIKIFQVVENGNYAALEEANAQSPVAVGLYVANSNTSAGITSAELMITYTYSSENEGYMSNLEIYAGQATSTPAASTTLETAASVLPEDSGKTVVGATLNGSYLNSDSLGDVGAGITYDIDANLSTNTPDCSATGNSMPDENNNFFQLYKDVTAAMDSQDSQTYYACYKSDETLITSDGAKMGGVLSYTYRWENTAPTSSILSYAQKGDGSGAVDLVIRAGDIDGHDIRAKLEYESGTACTFASPLDPSLDESDSNITADYGDPNIENDNTYQVGTADAYIQTATGSNRVYLDWLSKDDIDDLEGDYCLRLVANDLYLDQAEAATATVHIDNLDPAPPGQLSLAARTGTTTTLKFGASSTEANFREYIVYYKQYDGTDPDQEDSAWASSSDINLSDRGYNNASTTKINGLIASTTYSFAIWAYDDYGNHASSSRVDITTNDAASSTFKSVGQRTDGSGIVDIEIEVDDANNQDTIRAKIEFATGTNCVFSEPGDPTLDEDPDSILADFGNPLVVDNRQAFQVGSSSGYIITSPGSNSVNFDWLSYLDLPQSDGEYCLSVLANDRFDDQAAIATATLTLDNVAPTSTGALGYGAVTTESIELIYATNTPGSDTNEPAGNAYRIFYKEGISGVSTKDTEHDNTDLNAYGYNSATSTVLEGLEANTWYVINIWTYDSYGNRATATEIAVKTDATLSNDSLDFSNALTFGPDNNIALAGTSTEWNFRVTVSEANGWYAIGSTTLRLANDNDSSAPYSDLAFRWQQTSQSFSEIGTDLDSAATLSANSTSTCAVNTCTLDFKLLMNKSFASSSVDYAAQVQSDNDFGTIDSDTYPDTYQVRFPYVAQIHYRWRNDDGGE